MRIKLFEDFTEYTLKMNNDTYNQYSKNRKRSEKVAWMNPGSQAENFRLVSNHIKSGESVLDYGCGVGDFLSHLKRRKIQIGDYLGVDINPTFIELAKKKYVDNEFNLITKIDQITGTYDKVCAIGVFTWYIGKKDFIHAINKLYEMCNKEVLLTLLYGPWRFDDYWTSKYRYYKEDLFLELFPKLEKNFEFSVSDDRTLLVRIKK
jgi:cyclopropane fatty-acyl-phospholipid synthase-like methyltransferase